MTNFKPGDEVKVTYQGIVKRITSCGHPEIDTLRGDYIYPDPQQSKIEVLVSVDPVGTIRYSMAPGALWVKITDKEWLFTNGKFYRILEVKNVELTDKDNPPAGHLW